MRRLLIILGLLLLLTVPVFARDAVTSLTEEITVDTDGAASVRVTAVVQFDTAPTAFLFPLNSAASNVNASGGSYRSSSVNGVDCIVFTNDLGFQGTQTFQCTYQLPRDAVNTETGQQFHISLIELGWQYAVESLQINLRFPVEVTNQPKWNSSYYGDVIDNYLHIELKGNDVSINSVAALKDRETLELLLDFPADSFHLAHLPGKTTSFNQIAFYTLAVLAAAYWFFFLRSRLLFARPHQTADIEATAGELPCLLFGELPDIAATLAHWGNLGYIVIHRNRRGQVILRRRMDMGNERKPAERRLFEAIFRRGNTCDIQGLRFRTVAKPASAALRGGWLKRIYLERAGNPHLLRMLTLLAALFVNLTVFDVLLPSGGARWLFLILLTLIFTALAYLIQAAADAFYKRHRLLRFCAAGFALALLILLSALAGCLGLMAQCILMQLLAAWLTMFGGRRTPVGEEAVRRNLGLRKYLRRIDRESLRRLTATDGQFFYRMLPYAEIMGSGKTYVKRFGRWPLEPCGWLTDAVRRPGTASEFYALYADILKDIRMESCNQMLGLPELPKLTTHLKASLRPNSKRLNTRAGRSEAVRRPPGKRSGNQQSSARRPEQRRTTASRTGKRRR